MVVAVDTVSKRVSIEFAVGFEVRYNEMAWYQHADPTRGQHLRRNITVLLACVRGFGSRTRWWIGRPALRQAGL